jgi:uncharacterized protein
MAQLLMPQATAVWLVDNTSLSFAQIADFCNMHPLEIQAVADGEVAVNIVGQNPVTGGQLDAEEIARCEKDPDARLKIRLREDLPQPKQTRSRYTPVSKRQDKPDAIEFLVRRYPQLSDAQITRLIGTTKQTITAVRDHTHKNSANLVPKDPVLLGLCSRDKLNAEIDKANAKVKAKESAMQNARAELAARDAAEIAAGDVSS